MNYLAVYTKNCAFSCHGAAYLLSLQGTKLYFTMTHPLEIKLIKLPFLTLNQIASVGKDSFCCFCCCC